jgi:N-acetylglucosaminyldiphosphoundecaprenol N-acetyl-beta-D-mannosaminyltransferase
MIATANDFFSEDAKPVSPRTEAKIPTAREMLNAPSIAILGIPFDNITTAQTVEAIEEMVRSRKPHYLATANVDFLVQAKHDVELRRILLDAHLVLCDGTPLLWASRLLGNPLPERVAGSDLVPLLIKIAEKKNYRIFFLGGTLEVATSASENLKKQHPELNIAGFYSPPFARLHEMDHEQICQRIQEAKPDLLFVSFGCPKQEKWIAMHYRSLGVPVCVGVGATIDFIAGKVKRAPRLMQKTGTEWIFRAVQEPRRLLGRYVKCLWWFSREIAQQWWSLQLAGGKKYFVRRAKSNTGKHDWKTVKLPERLDVEAVRRDTLLCEEALATSRQCFLDLSAVKFVDSTGIGLLIRLQKKTRITGQQLILVAPSPAMESALRLMRLREFFIVAHDISEAKKLSDLSIVANPVLLQQNYFPSKPALFWRGEITAANADRVWQITKTHISSRTKSKEPLQIDLSSLDFIDSTGVGLMLRAKKDASAQGTKLAFIGTKPNVKNVLRLSNLESLLLEGE